MHCHLCTRYTPELGCDHYEPEKHLTPSELINDPLVNHFILTFKSGSNAWREVQYWDTRLGLTQWWCDITGGKAKLISFDKVKIEIAIPIELFLELKENRAFQQRCVNLRRIRTSGHRTLIHKLVYPTDWIDNSITDEQVKSLENLVHDVIRG